MRVRTYKINEDDIYNYVTLYNEDIERIEDVLVREDCDEMYRILEKMVQKKKISEAFKKKQD